MSDPVITKDMCIGAVMQKWPVTVEVFRSWFGKGCYTCPGSMREDIEFGANMHNVNHEAVLKELNAAIAKKQPARTLGEMMKVSKEMVVNDCIKTYPKTIGVFTKFSIDSCCGGAVPIEAAARRDGADLDALLAALNEAASE